MHCPSFRTTFLVAAALTALAGVSAASADPMANTRHVLLISIDGMHAADLRNCIKAKLCPHLAALATQGVTYERASTSQPSDASRRTIAEPAMPL